MMADMTKDRRVTVLIQGPNLPAFSDGSRLFAALPSPVHEELGYGLSRPTGYKVMRIFPLSLPTAESSVMSPHPRRTHPLAVHRSSPTDSPRSIVDDLWTASSLHNQASPLDKPNPIQRYGLSRPTGYKVMRIFPLSLPPAESSFMSPQPRRTHPLAIHRSSPTDSPRSIVDDLWTASSLHNQAPPLDKPNPIQG